MKKNGFTIVELLVVVAIIGILIGIISTVASSSMKSARAKRADVMCRAFQQAINTYHSQNANGEWPGKIEELVNGNVQYDKASTTITLEPADADIVFRAIVEQSVGANATSPLIDATALFVARESSVKATNGGKGCFDNHGDKTGRIKSSYCGDKKCVSGVDFAEASKKDGKHYIPVEERVFGWQGVENGKFCRFWITYNAKTDSVAVSRKKPGIYYPSDWK